MVLVTTLRELRTAGAILISLAVARALPPFSL